MKKKEVVTKVKKEVPKFVSKYKEIDLDSLMKVENINLVVNLKDFNSEYKQIELKVPMSYTFSKVVSIINEKNCNSCKNIKLFLVDNNSNFKSLDELMDKTFIEIGLKPQIGALSLYYTFDPVENPLLLAGYYQI